MSEDVITELVKNAEDQIQMVLYNLKLTVNRIDDTDRTIKNLTVSRDLSVRISVE